MCMCKCLTQNFVAPFMQAIVLGVIHIVCTHKIKEFLPPSPPSMLFVLEKWYFFQRVYALASPPFVCTYYMNVP